MLEGRLCLEVPVALDVPLGLALRFLRIVPDGLGLQSGIVVAGVPAVVAVVVGKGAEIVLAWGDEEELSGPASDALLSQDGVGAVEQLDDDA